MSATRADVEAEARTWMRTPFQHQQRMKGIAVDCAGLIIGVARALHLVAPDFDVTAYPRRPDGRSLLGECDKWMDRIPRDALQLADVIVVRFERDPQHLGFVGNHPVRGRTMIHALGTPDGRGRVVEHTLDASTMKRCVAAYQLRGVA